MSDFKLNPINLEDEERRKKLIQAVDNIRDVIPYPRTPNNCLF